VVLDMIRYPSKKPRGSREPRGGRSSDSEVRSATAQLPTTRYRRKLARTNGRSPR